MKALQEFNILRHFKTLLRPKAFGLGFQEHKHRLNYAASSQGASSHMGCSQQRNQNSFSMRLWHKEGVTSAHPQTMQTRTKELGQTKVEGRLEETLRAERGVLLFYEYEKKRHKVKGKE